MTATPKPPIPAIHRMYVDDSGEKEYGPNTSRYFVYAGVIVHAKEEAVLNEQLAAIKTKHLGRSDIEIKSNWIRHPKERRRRYLYPLGIDDVVLDAFAVEVQSWMEGMPARFVGIAIDKQQMQMRYKTPFYASTTAYQFLLQRLELHMRSFIGTGQPVSGQVTIDNMEGASPKANQWRDLLRSQHERMIKDGCRFTKLRFENCAKQLRFADSSKFHLLQIADLVAYNVFRQFREYGDAWDAIKTGELPTYPKLKPLLKRFLRGPNNQWEGYGIVKWPRQRDGRLFLTAEELA